MTIRCKKSSSLHVEYCLKKAVDSFTCFALSSSVSSQGILHAETLLISKYSVRIVKTVPLLISNMDKGMHINVFINWLHAFNHINIISIGEVLI